MRRIGHVENVGIFFRLRTEALPGVLGNRGTRAIFSGEQGNKCLKIRGTHAILWNREHRKSRFCFWEQGNKEIFSREQGNRYPTGRSSGLCRPFSDT